MHECSTALYEVEFPSFTIVRWGEITVFLMIKICTKQLCVCVGVYRQWSFSPQQFIKGFNGNMLPDTADGD